MGLEHATDCWRRIKEKRAELASVAHTHILPRAATREDIMSQIYMEIQDCLAQLLHEKKLPITEQ